MTVAAGHEIAILCLFWVLKISHSRGRLGLNEIFSAVASAHLRLQLRRHTENAVSKKKMRHEKTHCDENWLSKICFDVCEKNCRNLLRAES